METCERPPTTTEEYSLRFPLSSRSPSAMWLPFFELYSGDNRAVIKSARSSQRSHFGRLPEDGWPTRRFQKSTRSRDVVILLVLPRQGVEIAEVLASWQERPRFFICQQLRFQGKYFS